MRNKHWAGHIDPTNALIKKLEQSEHRYYSKRATGEALWATIVASCLDANKKRNGCLMETKVSRVGAECDLGFTSQAGRQEKRAPEQTFWQLGRDIDP